MKCARFGKNGKWRLGKTVVEVINEAPAQYARILADEMGLTGEKRYMFIAKVEQTSDIYKGLAIVGAATLLVTPYILVKAVTK